MGKKWKSQEKFYNFPDFSNILDSLELIEKNKYTANPGENRGQPGAWLKKRRVIP
jgi:hypothetical protein